MSQRETLEHVTSEWRTTSEIAGAVPMSRRIDPDAHVRAVYWDLSRLAKEGSVQKRMLGRQAAWRLP